MAEPRAFVREGAWEMGVTRAEFLRLLPAAVEGVDCAREGDFISGTTRGVAWRLELHERGPRRVAGLSVPVLQVTIRTESAEAADADLFLRRFLRAFQRAGG